MNVPLIFDCKDETSKRNFRAISSAFSNDKYYKDMINNEMKSLYNGDLKQGLYAEKSQIANTALTTESRKLSSVIASQTITTTQTQISEGIFIKDKELTAGSILRICITGACTASAANVSTFKITYGLTNSIADTTYGTFNLTSATSGTNIKFKIYIDTVFRATTSYNEFTLLNTGITGIDTLTVRNLTQAPSFPRTKSGYLNVNFVTAATTTSCIINTVNMEVLIK